MKKTRKLVSVILVLAVILTALPMFAAAKNENDYVPAFDRDTPVIIIHGIGQNDTYIVDEDGNRLKDKSGGDLTGWPLEIDIGALLKTALPSLLMAVITRKDSGLQQAMKKAAYNLLFAIHKDSEGNYENNVEVPCYQCPISEMPEDIREMYYRRLPMQECGEIIGEDNVYVFGYDSLGDVATTARLLHEFITETVMPQTGAKQVNICPISMGGSVAVQYMEMYPQDYKLIKKMVYVVPAINGSDIVGDILVGNLSIEDRDALYSDIFTTLMGESIGTNLLNMVLRVLLPNEVLKGMVYGLADGVVEAAIRNTTQLWALCPTEHYPEARAKWLADEEHSVMAEKVDAFMLARDHFEANQNQMIAGGTQVFDVVCYGLPLFPLSKNYNKTNSDGIIQSSSTSMGATFADLGTTLPDDYQAKGTYCSNPDHDHISPDRVVDPTTGLLPDTTWYFCGQSHESLANNDVCLKLAINIMVDDNMVDVYSNAKAFPQYNYARNTKKVDNWIEDFAEFEADGVAADKLAAAEAAIEQCKALENETVIDPAAWENAQAQLEEALVGIGMIKASGKSKAEVFFIKVTKGMNDLMGKIVK